VAPFPSILQLLPEFFRTAHKKTHTLIGLSTCQPLKCPPPEKINTMVGIPAPGENESWSSAILPYAIAAVGRLGVVKQRIDPLM